MAALPTSLSPAAAAVLSLTLGLLLLVWSVWPASRASQHRTHFGEQRQQQQQRQRQSQPLHRAVLVAFFHPFCDTGGGGERVLWTAVEAVQQQMPNAVLAVYTWDHAGSADQILARVKSQFDIAVQPNRIKFVYLRSWRWLEAKRYKRLTLIGQSLGSMITGWEAMQQLVPDVFVETVGFAFLCPMARFFGAKVVSYVHYPTISADMLGKVMRRATDFNNAGFVARSSVLSSAKLMYYRAFAVMYGYMGSFSDVVMVNSSWTEGHINGIWNIPKQTTLVYPPCDTKALVKLPLANRDPIVLSIAQFRPEKNHKLQLDAFARLLRQHPEHAGKVVLTLVGSVRNADDAGRVEQLRKHIASDASLKASVKIVENAAYGELQRLLSVSLMGIHTMSDEHFGISIIEYMAAGLIPIAHNSAGPKMDIVKPFNSKPTGFLATTEEEYAERMHEVLSLSPKERLALQQAARASVADRFSASAFADTFIACLSKALD
ncbi:hypothetical protein BC831DRAFT_399272 [Entophlyctis helioformis]|nr:hypothetical protein BC831DRAFT_399272 [Entophlyctis helioformis]